MEPIQIPLIGNAWFIGLIALLHFPLVAIGGLGPMVIFLTEGNARKNGNTHLLRMLHDLQSISIEIGVIGGVLGSGLVIAVLGLRPVVLTLIFNIFFWFLFFQLVCFIAGLGFQYASYFTWDKPQSNHRLWALVAAILPLIPFITFTAATSFINNPGQWNQSGNVWSAVFNPVTIPSLLHRAAAGVALLGALLVVIHAYQKRGKNVDEVAYHETIIQWAIRLATIALDVQIILGILRYFVVRPEGRRLIEGGSLFPLFLTGIVLGLAAMVYLHIAARRKALRTTPLLVCLALLPIIGAVWIMDITRSLERGSDSIAGVISRKDDLLTLPPLYQAAIGPISGETIYKKSCGACHPGLAGDAPGMAKARHSEASNLIEFLRDPSKYKVTMPPYKGTDDEINALVKYLLNK
jgi:cytochrome c5